MFGLVYLGFCVCSMMSPLCLVLFHWTDTSVVRCSIELGYPPYWWLLGLAAVSGPASEGGSLCGSLQAEAFPLGAFHCYVFKKHMRETRLKSFHRSLLCRPQFPDTLDQKTIKVAQQNTVQVLAPCRENGPQLWEMFFTFRQRIWGT